MSTGATTATPVWLDCDPGHDDAMAILLIAGTPGLSLVGVSTTGGNQTLDKTSANAAGVLGLVDGGSEVRLVRGVESSLLPSSRGPCGEIHGECGLDGSAAFAELRGSIDLCARVDDGPAPVAMATAIPAAAAAAGAKVVIVATGPQTNVALFLALYPDVAAEHVDKIVFMGGAASGVGNTGRTAEFNIQMDPVAAAMVASTSPVPVVMVPLEVTHTVLYDEVQAERVARLASAFPLGKLLHGWMTFFAATYKDEFGFDAPPLHDPVAVFYLIAPQAFEEIHTFVDVDTTRGGMCEGQTVLDRFGLTGSPPNMHVTTAVDVDAFWDAMFAALKRVAATSPLTDA